jgi:hypothetical protein
VANQVVHNTARASCWAQKELTAFSEEISDEEFERYMAYIYAERGRTP